MLQSTSGNIKALKSKFNEVKSAIPSPGEALTIDQLRALGSLMGIREEALALGTEGEIIAREISAFMSRCLSWLNPGGRNLFEKVLERQNEKKSGGDPAMLSSR